MRSGLSRFLVGLTLAATVAGVSACGAGLSSGTSLETGRVPGRGGNHGSIGLRDFYLVTPTAGASTTWLTGAVVNQGRTTDTLTSVTVSGAGAVRILKPGQSVPLPAIGPSVTASPLPPASASPSTATTGTSGSAVPIPAGSLVSFIPPAYQPGSPSLLVTGLQGQLTTGDYVQATFTFAGAGTVNLRLPVAPLPRTTD